jgi:hypothetical protein
VHHARRGERDGFDTPENAPSRTLPHRDSHGVRSPPPGAANSRDTFWPASENETPGVARRRLHSSDSKRSCSAAATLAFDEEQAPGGSRSDAVPLLRS